jgi:pyruvate formate lyase activating enzyme
VEEIRKETKTGDIEDSSLGPQFSPEQISKICLDGRLPSISFVYNEHTVCLEYALDGARLLHLKGMRVVFSLNAYQRNQGIEGMVGIVDGVVVDEKGFNRRILSKTQKCSSL